MSKSERFSWGNLIFLFVVAFLAGMIAKKTVGNHIRIGFDDPSTVISQGTLYDIDVLEQELLSKGIPEEVTTTVTEESQSDIQ